MSPHYHHHRRLCLDRTLSVGICTGTHLSDNPPHVIVWPELLSRQLSAVGENLDGR